ncbi:SCO4848 family membrane protein [Aeromicrobium alkaliterrae]|uniref:Integral membrane protein n=1 Tax=Aeromicrobium alkaliterrae TaxID=302168 RepID=A0ABN2K2Q1_9ACTN
MTLPVGVAILLLVVGLWNLVIWPQFAKRIMADPRSRDESGGRTTFFNVHAVLISVSLSLGLATGFVGLVGLIG